MGAQTRGGHQGTAGSFCVRKHKYLYSRQVTLKPFVIEQHADLSIKYVKFTRSAKKYIEICFICLLTSSVI